MGYTDGKVLGSDKGIKLGSNDGKLIGTIVGNVDIITLEIDVGTDLGYLDGSLDDSNYGLLEGFCGLFYIRMLILSSPSIN